MLDLKLIREHSDIVEKGAKNKGIEINLSHILEIDKRHKELFLSVQKLRGERNILVKSIKGKPTAEQINNGKNIKEKLEKEEHALKAVEEELKKELLQIPNLPLKDVPIGDPSKFELIREVGKPKNFNFKVKDHLDIGEALDIIDTQRATKVSGTRFAYLKNEAVLLEFALIQFVLNKLIDNGFSPILPPALIRFEITKELGYWERGNHNNYYLVSDYEETIESKEKENPLYLIGTAEHSIVPMYKDEVFNSKDLPKKYIGFSSAFRREAGTYGKDTKGILRVHQFDKLEMVEFVRQEDDEKERNNMLSLVEEFMKDLELPYRVVKLASRDLAFPTAQTIDIETWIPSQNKYRETHSISTTTDFQSRRLNIKYKDGEEKKFVHILNGTAFAIGRTIIAILENYQEVDGNVLIPKVLQKYLGKTAIKPQK